MGPGEPSCVVNMFPKLARQSSRCCSLFLFDYHLFLRILVTVKYQQSTLQKT